MGVLTYTADNGLTVRQQIVRALKVKIEDMQDDGAAVWRKVYNGDLEDLDNRNMPSAGLDFGTEEMLNNTFPCSTYSLPMFVYFRYRGKHGLDEHDLFQYYLGLLQFALLGDHNLGGLALDVEEESNSHNIIGVEDVYPGGVFVTRVLYRTRLHNPYNQP